MQTEARPDRQTLVSVVVATYDDIDYTARCLKSLQEQTHSPLEVIVVDNGSRADIAARLAVGFPCCTVVRNERNAGFAGGFNRGIREARGRYIAILNNDAVAEPGWIASMVEVAERHPDVGAVASVVIDGHRRNKVDSLGLGIALDGMSRQMGTGRDANEPRPEMEVLAASGCACLFSAEALARVGLFDESFFAYCEDTDLALRMRWAGYRVLLAPSARVLHYHSQTAGRFSAQKVFWVERNHFWVAVKSFPLLLLVLLPAMTSWRYVIQAADVAGRRGEVREFSSQDGVWWLAIAVARAIASALAGLPRVWCQRQAIMHAARLPSSAMLRTILRFRLSLSEVLRR